MNDLDFQLDNFVSYRVGVGQTFFKIKIKETGYMVFRHVNKIDSNDDSNLFSVSVKINRSENI